MAAGFDKHGEAIDGLFDLGFGYVEIGSITPEPQPGNPQPRLFRLPSTQSVINRYGFNSEGHLAVLERLRARIHAYVTKNALLLPSATFPAPTISADPDPDPVEAILSNSSDTKVIESLGIPKSLKAGKILAINLGKNKVSAPESVDDFVNGVHTLGPYADILVVNVSSPNTPGLRSLQRRGMIQELLGEVIKARDSLSSNEKPVVLLKIAPDLSRQEVADIGIAAKETGVDGIIVSNTTISRPPTAGHGEWIAVVMTSLRVAELVSESVTFYLRSLGDDYPDPAINEVGGLSGPPLKPLALGTLQTLYALTGGSIPLIGCGGISTGADAIDYARAGASFVQLYTALGYQGVGLPRMIKDEIVAELKKENKTWKDLVGTGVDLASIQRLGREHNPANLLSLEEEGSDGLSKLKQEIEDVLSGKISDFTPIKSTEEQPQQTIPAWNEAPSPAVYTQSTVPTATVSSTSQAESGMTSSSEPQIIIVDKVPEYTPAQPMSKEEMAAKYEEAKRRAAEIAKDVKEAGSATKDAFSEVGRQIGQESRAVGHEVEEAAKTTRDNFQEIGSDIKDDTKVAAKEFDRAYGEDIKAAAKQTGEAYRELGHEIKEESKVVGEELRKAAARAGEAFRDLGREVSKESQEAGDIVRDAASQTADNFSTIGKEIKQDSKEATEGFATEARKEVNRIVEGGPTGEPDRSGGGIWSLGSTIGMRGKVSSESKRLV